MIDGLLTYEEALAIREKEDELKRTVDGYQSSIIMPQLGFQERVLRCNADILFIGGNRGGGKTFSITLLPLYHVENERFECAFIRRELGDIDRGGGLWKTSFSVYEKMAFPTATNFTWTFKWGSRVRYEHMANEDKADQRFRGQQIPLIGIDEIDQIGESTFWLLLSSNRNTAGIKNQIVGTCNPNPKSWVRKMIDWYIGADGYPIEEREGVIRYFYKYGETVEEIIWGDTKEEVYSKAKTYIDKVYTTELSKVISKDNLIKSFIFIRGAVTENKILLENDPDYVGSIAQGGEAAVKRNLEGNWNEFESSEEMLTSDQMRKCFFANIPQQDGIRWITADIALQGEDKFVAYVWDGFHIIDISILQCSSGKQVMDELKLIASRYKIPNKRIIYDANGLGAYIGGKQNNTFLPGSIAFFNNGRAKENSLYFNLKSECADRMVTRMKNMGYSIDETLLTRMFGDKSLKEHLLDERRTLREFEKGSFLDGKFRLIKKEEMRRILGHSPDFIDGILMREYGEQKKSNIVGLGNFSF